MLGRPRQSIRQQPVTEKGQVNFRSHLTDPRKPDLDCHQETRRPAVVYLLSGPKYRINQIHGDIGSPCIPACRPANDLATNIKSGS
jgi:hypothetical protein